MTGRRASAPASARRRLGTRAACALACAAATLALLGGLLTYVGAVVTDSGEFADRTSSVLRQAPVRAAVARRVTAQLVAARPDLSAVRPLIEGGADRVVGSTPFVSLFRGATYDLHRSLFDTDSSSVVLGIADVGVLVDAALHRLAPSAAARVPPAVRTTLANASQGELGRISDVARAAEKVRRAGVWLLAGAALLLLVAVALAADRVAALAAAGLALFGAGTAVVVAYTVARPLVLARFAGGDPRTAAAAVWDAFLSDLRAIAILVAVAGALVAAVARTVAGATAGELPRRAARLVTRPAPGREAVARALLAIAAGAALVVARDTALRLVVAAGGAWLVYVGIRWLMAEVARLSLRRPERGRPRTGVRRRTAVAAGLAALLTLLTVAAEGATHSTAAAPAQVATCNGHVALCDRAVDKVAFAATHNSMGSSTLTGWLFANQDGDIPSQLATGVRGLLIDTYYGVATKRGVATILGAANAKRKAADASLGSQFIATAERLRARLGYRGGGKRAMFLCHGFCEVGSTPLDRALGEIRDFVVNHPGDVLILSIQDDISPTDTEAAFRRAGLLDLVYRGPAGPPWPTLRRLVDEDRRILVFGENQTGGLDWYRPQFQLFQETPYSFKTVAALGAPQSCRPNRGGTRGSLFLLNHWVDTSPAPRPTNASRVNAKGFLLGRARRCQAERGRLPNLVAIDFYRRGDLMAVVDALNGFR